MIKKKNSLLFFKNDKMMALRAIDKSINNWETFRNKNLFLNLLKKNHSTHWEPSGILSPYFDVHLVWSNVIIRSIKQINKNEVFEALISLKEFYSKISTLKPDLSNPDILLCFNLSARKNGQKEKKIILKENIEVEVLNPFKNIIGKEMKIFQKKMNYQKRCVLDDLEYSLFFLDQFDNKLEKENYRTLKKPKNFLINKDEKSFSVKLFWCEIEVESNEFTNIKKIKAKLKLYKKTINSLNVKRLNLSNPLIQKIYNISNK